MYDEIEGESKDATTQRRNLGDGADARDHHPVRCTKVVTSHRPDLILGRRLSPVLRLRRCRIPLATRGSNGKRA
jgi:hypothetical protein